MFLWKKIVDACKSTYLPDPTTCTDKKELVLGVFGKRGIAKGTLNMPCGVTLTENGNIIIADSENHRIQIFNKEGQLISVFGQKGRRNEDFNYPMCVALTLDENIAVADSVNAAVKVFTQDGHFVTILGNKILEFPHGLAVIKNETKFVVTDICKHCVLIFDSVGNLNLKFGSFGDGPQEFDHPYFVAVNSQNEVIISDSGNCSVKIFSIKGILLLYHNVYESRIHNEQYISLQGVCVHEDLILVVGDESIYVVLPNGRLWEILPAGFKIQSAKCLAISSMGWMVVTQAGFKNLWGVTILKYDPDVLKSLQMGFKQGLISVLNQVQISHSSTQTV